MDSEAAALRGCHTYVSKAQDPSHRSVRYEARLFLRSSSSTAAMSDAMQGVMPAPIIPPANGADFATPPQPMDASAPLEGVASPTAPPEPPEVVATETLYIQNLNERIKVDGKSVYILKMHSLANLVISSDEADFTGTIQELWRGP